MYKLSKYLLRYPDPNGTGAIFVNAFRPAMDIVPKAICDRVMQGDFNIDKKILQYLLRRGYLHSTLVDEEATAWAEYCALSTEKPTQLLYYVMTTLACNFTCPYCFQQNLKQEKGYLTSTLLERIFGMIESFERSHKDSQSPKRSLLTVMGGETLLSPHSLQVQQCVESLLSKAKALSLDTIFYTNGFYLSEFASTLKSVHVNVTIDGSRTVHNQRRVGPCGIETFDRIIEGIRTFLKVKDDKVKLFLRINVDKENIEDIDVLIEYLWKHHLLQHPGLTWYPALIINHAGELEYQYFSERLEVTRCILKIISNRPEVFRSLNLNRFRGLQYVADALRGQASKAYPQYFRCHSNYNGVSFDFRGNVYPCHACMDKQKEGINHTSQVDEIINSELFSRWRNRSVFSFSKCQNCRGKFICLGGCPRECLEQNGSIMDPLCYPFDAEIGLALDCFLRPEVKAVLEDMCE